MMDRVMRPCLVILGLALGVVPACLYTDNGAASDSVKPSAAQVNMNPDAILALKRIEPQGEWEEATVPDTLDLADRAALSINALIGEVDPSDFYGIYQSYKFNADPPHIEGGSDALYGVVLEPRSVRTLPMLRAMSGSSFGLETERGMMRALLDQVQRNGQMVYPHTLNNPVHDMSYPGRMAMMAFAADTWYGRDPNPQWLDWVDLLSDGLKRDAIHVEDRAYYPVQSAIDASGTWHDMVNGAAGPTPYHTPEEAPQDQIGQEGTAKNDLTRALSTLVLDYRLTGNEASLQLAQELGREILRPALWVNTSSEGFVGSEHAVWEGHFHASVHTLVGLLDLAEADHDPWLREFVREGYANAIRNGVVRVGWFPAWIDPTKFGRPAWLAADDEICGVGDVAVLGVRLSDAGIGDYWDDVDSIVRNQLSAAQIVDVNLMKRAAGVTTDAYRPDFERFRGGFGLGGFTAIDENGQVAGCCTGNGSQALYYAWEGITRFHDGTATVNLFLNRASPWMDIDSDLPYEGKVVLHNKLAKTVMVRIPSWVDRSTVAVTRNGGPVDTTPAGRYLIVSGLAPRDNVTLTFPVRTELDHYTIAGTRYTVTFRGSTVVDISPRYDGPHSYPLYLRSALLAKSAPMRSKKRFVADRLIPLGVY
jgi:hypothetical protein